MASASLSLYAPIPRSGRRSRQVGEQDLGVLRGVLEVPLAEEFGDNNVVDIDCSLEIADPASDVEAFISGWAAQTVIPEDIVAGTAAA